MDKLSITDNDSYVVAKSNLLKKVRLRSQLEYEINSLCWAIKAYETELKKSSDLPLNL